MKKRHKILILGLMALFLAVATVYGAMTNSATEITQHPNFITSGSAYMNPVYKFCAEVQDILEGTQAIPAMKPTVTIYGASTTLTIAESGNVIVVDGNDAGSGNVILNLPEASTAIGVFYTVADVNVTAGDDVYIKAAAGDTIDGGTAGQYLASKTDTAGQTVTLLAIDDTRWIIWAVDGTWVADDAPD
jgi:hypothetical protein